MMQLVEKHDFLKGSAEYKELDQLCFLSKNLYNAGLYVVRKHFFETKKNLSYGNLEKQFVDTNQADFRALPAKVSQYTLKLINQNFNSFFALLKRKKAGEYSEKVRIPAYLPKQTGRQILHYTSQAVSTKARRGYIHLSQTNIFIKSKIGKVQFVRVVHKRRKITVEIGYKRKLPKEKILTCPREFSAIDIGVNNLATVTFANSRPFIVNGKPLKSTFQQNQC